MLLATFQHHSARSGELHGEGPEARHTPAGALQLEEEPGGSRPAPLPEVADWEGNVEQHVVEDLGELAPLVQILDLLVPQMVENVTDTLRILDLPIAEQVIEVPKISCSPCPLRSLVPEPQTAEQLVDVPTVLSRTRIALQIAKQIVGIPVPQGLGGMRRIQGFLPDRVPERRLLFWNAFLSGLWSRSLAFLLRVVALDRNLPLLLVLQMRILLGFFALFPNF